MAENGIYQAFLLRLWRETAATPWRYLLQDVPNGQQRGFASLESLFTYLDHTLYQNKEIIMAEHPNATLIRQAIEAFNQGNPGALTALIADDAVFTVPGWIFSVRDGRIIEGRNLQENQDAIDAFWSAGEFMATMTSDNAA